MKLGLLVLLSCVAAVLAPAAVAASSPAGQIQSLRVDQGAAAHGAAVTATVDVTNPGDKRSKKLNLLLKLRAPDGESGVLLTSKQVGKLGPGDSRTVELTASIPDDAPAGDSTLVACRAKKDSADACGVSRQQAPLRVLTPARLVISPGAHAFESHATGTTSPTRTFTITNTGETASQPIATSITGADPNQFTRSADGCDGQTLAAGESCEVNAAFAPTATGDKSGGLRASTSESSATAALTGTGVAPANLTISPSPHGFGTHATGTTSGAQTFTVTNTGGAPSGTIATAVAGTDAGQFTKAADTCNGQTLAPGASCTLNGAFAPTSVGAKAASLQASAAPGGSAAAGLSGTGAAPANLTISPTPHGFGTQVINTTSGAQTFTVTNNGGVPSGTIATSVGGADPGQFAKSADSCNGQTLAPGASCTVDGAFAPTSVGAKAANLQATAAPGGTALASLVGTGATPANLTISPNPHGFGAMVNGSTSAAQTFTVTNTGGVPSGSINTGLTGTDSDQFAKSADNCDGLTLGPGASCTVDGAFAPTSSGGKSASLQATATPGGTASASLTGTGQTPANLQISPASHDFGNVVQGGSARQTFTITNVGEQTAQFDLITVTGSDGPQFNFGTNTCSATFGSISGGGSCTIELIWLPPSGSTPGPLDARFDVHSTVPGGTVSATLSGNAVTTPANLQIGITSSSTATPTYGSSASRDVGDLPGGAGSTVYIRIKNSGAADAVISNSPVPINRTNAGAELFAAMFATCPVSGGLDATEIPFANLVVAGGSECYFPMRVTGAGVGALSVDFTITGSPGGSITATITGTRSS